jgi:hypothetical protein
MLDAAVAALDIRDAAASRGAAEARNAADA